MKTRNELSQLSIQTETIIGFPFEWCFVSGGEVALLDASDYGGTTGGHIGLVILQLANISLPTDNIRVSWNTPTVFANQRGGIFLLKVVNGEKIILNPNRLPLKEEIYQQHA